MEREDRGDEADRTDSERRSDGEGCEVVVREMTEDVKAADVSSIESDVMDRMTDVIYQVFDGREDVVRDGFKASLVYGEITPESFLSMLRDGCAALAVKGVPDDDLVFADVGSGEGMALCVAASSGLFSRVIGIEIVEHRHAEAVKRTEAFRKAWTGSMAPIDLLHGDLREMASVWTAAHVVFAHCTCFEPKLMDDVSRLAEGMPRGGVLLAVSNAVESPLFEPVEMDRSIVLDWGTGSGFIQRRSRMGKFMSRILNTGS